MRNEISEDVVENFKCRNYLFFMRNPYYNTNFFLFKCRILILTMLDIKV